MYHIVLIDDEKIAIDGLYEVVEEEFGECIVFKAGSGNEALELFEKYRIDIAVIDINMPGISGLELQRIVREKWPRCRSIFLTGYDRSDYVRQAMRGGGADYILKLEGDDMVVEAIRKNLAALEEEEKKKLENARMRSLIAEKEKQLKGYLLRQLISEPVSEETKFTEQCRESGIRIDFKRPVWSLAGKISDESGESRDIAREEAETADMILREMVEADCIIESIYDSESCVFWLFQAERADSLAGLQKMHYLELRNKIMQYLELVQDVYFEETGRNIAFLGMEPESMLGDIFWHFRIMKLRFLQLGFYDQGNIQLLDAGLEEDEPEQEQEGDIFPILCDYISEGMRRETYTLFQQLIREKRPGGRVTQRSFYEAGLLVYRLLDKYQLKTQMDRTYNLCKLLEFHDFENEFDIEYYFADILHKIFQLLQLRGDMQKDKVLSMINSYIHGHLGEELSMNVLAGLVHFNPSYLSRLYKKKMGMSVTDYIARVRLKRACTLLKETDKKVSDIAGETGFSSAGYFSRTFNKEFSMTPQDYRNKYKGN